VLPVDPEAVVGPLVVEQQAVVERPVDPEAVVERPVDPEAVVERPVDSEAVAGLLNDQQEEVVRLAGHEVVVVDLVREPRRPGQVHWAGYGRP
jgi:hypothetical protein